MCILFKTDFTTSSVLLPTSFPSLLVPKDFATVPRAISVAPCTTPLTLEIFRAISEVTPACLNFTYSKLEASSALVTPAAAVPSPGKNAFKIPGIATAPE